MSNEDKTVEDTAPGLSGKVKTKKELDKESLAATAPGLNAKTETAPGLGGKLPTEKEDDTAGGLNG